MKWRSLRLIEPKLKLDNIWIQILCSKQWWWPVSLSFIGLYLNIRIWVQDFLGGPVVMNLPAKTRDMHSVPGPWRFLMLRGTKPMRHNYWACTLGSDVCNYQAHAPARAHGAREPSDPQQKKPLQWEARAPQLESISFSPQLEKAHSQQQRPRTAKKISTLKKKKNLISEASIYFSLFLFLFLQRNKCIHLPLSWTSYFKH